MTTNKIIAEKINVFLNLLYHLEDYITNQQIREEQLHISNNVKLILSEVADSPKVKAYFYKGVDINREYEDNEIEPEFKIMRLTEDKIKYIKKANPQSFNQKNLQLLNYFYNSSGEADMIYDSIKYKMLAIIKFCLTQIMLKKYKEKEKEIYSKINFVLISKNNKLLRELKNSKSSIFDSINKFSLVKKNASLPDIKEQFRLKPNFIIPPPINTGIIKNNNMKKADKKNLNYNIEEYNKTSFSKNYKLVQQNSKNNENYPNINNFRKTNYYNNKIQISPSSQLDLIHILHRKKKRPEYKLPKTANKEIKNDNNNFYIKIVNGNDNDKLTQELMKKRNLSELKKLNKKNENKKTDKQINSKGYDYNKIFNMFEALKKRGYLY